MIDKYIKQIFGDYEERIKQDYGIIEVNPNVDEYNVSYRVHTHARDIFFKE